MGIRGDAEAKYWSELGREKIREIVIHTLDCLSDPNLFLRMEKELEMTPEELMNYFYCTNWIRKNLVTHAT